MILSGALTMKSQEDIVSLAYQYYDARLYARENNILARGAFEIRFRG
jgi:hypothetical protein